MTHSFLRCLVTALAALVIVWALALVSFAAEPPIAERPAYTIGTIWILTDGVYELVRIENDRYIFAASPTRQIHLTRDLVIAHVEKDGDYLALDPPPKLSWPLKVGTSGT